MIKVLVDSEEMDPGEVIFRLRYEELSATFQGLLENDQDEMCLGPDPLTGAITIDGLKNGQWGPTPKKP